MVKGKRGSTLDVGFFYENWAELLGFAFLIVGFLFALIVGSAFMSSVIIFLCGMIVGRIWYNERKNMKFPILMIIVAFLVGYVIGNRYQQPWWLILGFFLLGGYLSYYLHEKKYV